MARLHEYQGKALLAGAKIPVPQGGPAASPEEARQLAADIGKTVVVKMQAWTTHRAGMGGIKFADTPDAAADAAKQIIGMTVGQFTVDRVLVEEKLAINREFFASLIIDDAAQRPILLFSTAGGTGIEDRAAAGAKTLAKCHIDVATGLRNHQARNLLREVGLSGKTQQAVAGVLVKAWNLAKKVEARSLEINPLVLTETGEVCAADCRVTVDDYAAFRHPELGIEIARELDHPPTLLERIAFAAEKDDYRGTFYFAQLAQGFSPADRYVGFHGAGGGGSMMSMDAVTRAGFKLANFTDTSGNPSASKVYRAAMIIMAQPNIIGYFGSGSGVASQEQYHSAYGLAKAFHEMQLSIPAVIRLGGNSEDRAVHILNEYCKHLLGTVEGYRKDDTPDHCAARLKTLAAEASGKSVAPMTPLKYTPPPGAYTFDINNGKVYIDHSRCSDQVAAILNEFAPGLFVSDNGKPVPAVEPDKIAGKDSEMIACEIECRAAGHDCFYVELPIPGLDEYRKEVFK